MKDELGRACSTHGEINAHKILVQKAEGIRQYGRPTHRWEYNIKRTYAN
jgi:hypothetical protein